MELKAIFEKGYFKVFNSEEKLIGEIKIYPKTNFDKSEIVIGDHHYNLIRKGWESTVYKNDNPLYHLKTNSFSGNTEIKELNRKVKGVWGLTWGTQLSDESGNTLLKIRNDKQFVDNGKCIIKLENGNVKTLEILLSLYGHLYGTSLKQKGVLMGIILGSSI